MYTHNTLCSVPLRILKGSMTGPGSIGVVISWVWWIRHFCEIMIAGGGFSHPLQFTSLYRAWKGMLSDYLSAKRTAPLIRFIRFYPCYTISLWPQTRYTSPFPFLSFQKCVLYIGHGRECSQITYRRKG